MPLGAPHGTAPLACNRPPTAVHSHAIPKEPERVRMSSPGSVTHWLQQLGAGDRGTVERLWQLLVVITARKATDLIRHCLRAKRGGGRSVSLSAAADSADAAGPLFAELIAHDPDPQFAAAAAEECRRLLGALDEPLLRSVA